MRKTSLQRWLRKYWLVTTILFVSMFLILHTVLVRNITLRTENGIRNSITISAVGIENSLQMVDGFVNEALYSDSTQSTSQLYYSLKNEKDPLSLLSARSAVLKSLQSIWTWSAMIDYIMLYTDREDEFKWLEVGGDQDIKVRNQIKQTLSDYLEDGNMSGIKRYMIWPSDYGNQMLRVLKVNGSYLVVGVSQREILNTLGRASFDEESISFAADENGNIIFSSAPLDCTINSENEGRYITVNGKRYLQTGYVSGQGNYYFGSLTLRADILKETFTFDMVFLIVSILIMLLFPLSIVLLRKNIEKPIETISDKMNEISEGDLDATVDEEFFIKELDVLVRAFNHMSSRLGQLKIEKYEMELEAQKATMQYLQQQLKPHFFANVLNIIYSLAERKDFETIQRLSKAIVSYSRYMFQDTRELVELSRELEQLGYYMEIQEIRYMKQIRMDIDIPDELLSALVPPFIILTFVENAVKYAFSSQKNSVIEVRAKADDDKEYMMITVHDNGAGYPDHVLNADLEDVSDEGHVGLTNIIRRLRLIYADKAQIELKNEDGAFTTIRIPCITMNDSFGDDDL
ncbi:sensor histidine kinase [Butyrivibrio sp. FCS006]|uniref:sensor histidine kinase n=1 Tax=Butyrivibrio sp. FCS006 TaxID=1280684 RepID=UPI000428EF0D|nr:histidine kinase [Butyrivibrio sp. FCS006]